MNRIIILFLVCTITSIGSSQTLIDTADLVFKAKLLTLNRFELQSRNSIFSDLESQEAALLLSPVKNLYFIEVVFNQSSSNGAEWLGSCNYYLAFNLSKNKYYKLGGFDSLDISDFFDDLRGSDFKIFDLDFLERSSIDFSCLSDFNDLSERRKRKRKFSCFEKCSDVMFKTLVISKSKE